MQENKSFPIAAVIGSGNVWWVVWVFWFFGFLFFFIMEI